MNGCEARPAPDCASPDADADADANAQADTEDITHDNAEDITHDITQAEAEGAGYCAVELGPGDGTAGAR